LTPNNSVTPLSSVEKVQSVTVNQLFPNKSAQTTSSFIKEHSGIYVIASPTETHVEYLRKLQAFGRRGVCEKPVTLDRRELDFLSRNEEIFSQVFLLSYYSLDKGLALTYLYDPRVVYEQYLSVQSPEGLAPSQVLSRLGSLESIDFSFQEPMTWHENTKGSITIRDLEDLVFHPFTLLGQVLGIDPRAGWDMKFDEDSKCDFSDNGEIKMHLNFIEKGTQNEIFVDIFISRDPKIPTKSRLMTANYSDGIVHADFDDKSCIVSNRSRETTWSAQIVPEFQQNYSAMFSLVNSWVNKEVDPRNYDVLPEQLWATRIWLDVRESLIP